MSAYPIEVFTETLEHKGGTKAYHFVILSARDGKSVVVFRFGKIGAFGQFLIERHHTFASAETAYKKKRKEKMGGGYHPKISDTKMMQNEEDLRKFLGPGYLPTFGADNLKHLDPLFETRGVKSPARGEWDEEGNKIDASKPADLSKFEEEERRKREEAERADYERMTSHENFGLF